MRIMEEEKRPEYISISPMDKNIDGKWVVHCDKEKVFEGSFEDSVNKAIELLDKFAINPKEEEKEADER